MTILQCLSEMPRGGKCNGIMRFTNIEFLDENNQPISPHCGKFIRIRLTVDVQHEGAKDCSVSVGIRTNYGDPLMTFPSALTTKNFSFSEGKHYIQLDIPKLPLTEGTYRIGLWASTYNLLGNNCADYIDNLIRMDVEDDDFFNQGKQLSSHLKGKIVLCDHNWNIE